MVAAAVGMAVVNMADFANLALLAPAGPLGRKLEEAVVVPSEEVPPDVITMQSVVALVDEASGERVVLSLVYPSEADAASGRVSVLAPLGMALFGATLGERLVCESGDLRVAELIYQPEQSMRTNLVVRD